MNGNILEIKSYALENDVPIMMDEGISFLTDYIKNNNVKNILEIGSAIGYSAIMMALVDPSIKVVTIERDEERYKEAVKNVKKLNLDKQITLIYGDALDVKIDGLFDLIFIDAAKSQSIKFFNIYSGNLSDNGAIITDNLNFHGYVLMDPKEIKSRNLRALVRKIKNYISFLKENKDYETTFYDLGDGISVTKRSLEVCK